MGMSPSKWRRKGREAFDPGLSPSREFSGSKWELMYHYKDFLDGWKEAEERYNNSPDKNENSSQGFHCPHCGEYIDNI